MDVKSHTEILGEIHNTVKPEESEVFINTLGQTRSGKILLEFAANLKTKRISVLP